MSAASWAMFLILLGAPEGFIQAKGVTQAIDELQPAESLTGKSIVAVRTDSPPTIDGRSTAGEWAAVAVVEDFHQVLPIEYTVPSEYTRVHVMYDSEALYIGARIHEQVPSLITRNVLKQNGSTRFEDAFAVILDTFYDGRTGYLFMVNANGVRKQAFFQDVTGKNFDWSGIWQVQTTVDDQGWFAEMRIPFKTISFDPEGTTWGINFQRWIVRHNETIAWSSDNQSVDPSTSGDLVGLRGLDQGLGLDVVPSLSVRQVRRFDPGEGKLEVEPSLDVFYRVTSALTAALTLNTDFSATEVDNRQVNLSRFNLFFPEKRDFFLEGADIFEFGRFGENGGNEYRSELPEAAQQSGRPYFSRKIGIGATGQPVDVIAGVKMTGRIGPWNIGLLDVRQDALGPVDEQNLLVGRVAVNVLEESTLGAIVTSGSPQSNLDNSLMGVDFRYRNTRLEGDNVLEGTAWYQRSDTEGIDDNQDAYGARLSLPNSVGLRAGIGIKLLEENFNPALGFVTRRGMRDQTAEIGYTRKMSQGIVQKFFTGIQAERIEGLDGELQTELIVLRPFELENETSDNLKAQAILHTEVLSEDFEIFPGIVVPRGRHEFDEFMLGVGFGAHRLLSGWLRAYQGDFYTGKRFKLVTQGEWKPSPHFAVTGHFEFNDVELAQGTFIARLMRLQMDFVYSNTLSWSTFLQYDNISESIGISSRVHWIPQAGRETFLVLNYGLRDLDLDNRFTSAYSDLVMKIGYTFRF